MVVTTGAGEPLITRRGILDGLTGDAAEDKRRDAPLVGDDEGKGEIGEIGTGNDKGCLLLEVLCMPSIMSIKSKGGCAYSTGRNTCSCLWMKLLVAEVMR